MSRRALTLIAIVSALAALVTVFYTQRSIDRLMTVRSFPVAVQNIPPYTIITADMLTEKELPKSLSAQAIYVNPAELIGKMSKVSIPAEVIIYRQFAVPPSEFRYVDDNYLSIISFPVEPEKAVGGQIRIGQNIDIWRVRLADTGRIENESLGNAESERIATGVRVVDIRSTKGERAGVVGKQAQSQVESVSTTTKEQVIPLTIVTVAVDEETAQSITRLMGEIAGHYDFWLSLSAVGENKKIANKNVVSYATATPLPTATLTPMPTATLPQVLIPQATATPVPPIENPTATPSATLVPTLENPSPTPVPPTITPILPTPTATPAWDYGLTVRGVEDFENEGPNYITGVLLDIDGKAIEAHPMMITWDGGKIDGVTAGGGTFEIVVGAGEYFFKLPDESVEPIRLKIPKDKRAHRLTITVKQVR